MRWDWILPEPVSNLGAEIDSIYYLILIITGIIFVVVEVALVWFLIRYRHREGRRAAYSHGNKSAEIVWTVVPFVLVLFIAYTSNGVWLKAKLADITASTDGNSVSSIQFHGAYELEGNYPPPTLLATPPMPLLWAPSPAKASEPDPGKKPRRKAAAPVRKPAGTKKAAKATKRVAVGKA